MKKKGINIVGPISADTAFMKNSNYKVFIGMYHDQVLIPFKTINKLILILLLEKNFNHQIMGRQKIEKEK